MRKTGLLAAALTAVAFASVGLAACGDNNSSADEDQITNAINAAATSGDPSACTKYQTVRFDEQTNAGKGQAAVRACEKSAEETAAEKVDVTDVQVDGDDATAKAKATGSIFDGQTLKISLVKENGQWKLDTFDGFENFNKDAMINAFKAQLAKEPGSTRQAVNCVAQQFQAASDQEIEATFTSNDPQAENRLFGPCGKYFKGG
jgi:hypothetical protein